MRYPKIKIVSSFNGVNLLQQKDCLSDVIILNADKMSEDKSMKNLLKIWPTSDILQEKQIQALYLKNLTAY